MKGKVKLSILVFSIILGVFIFIDSSFGMLKKGQSAPVFSLEGVKGGAYDLSKVTDTPIMVLYFFDAESAPSQEGLFTLNELLKRYKAVDLTVWAITASPKEKATGFISRNGLDFPVLIDNQDVSSLYQADIILPTICIVGPGQKILDYFQGGGKTTEIMLVRLAERELQRKQTELAKAISEEVVKKNPQNIKAEAIKGYAALKEGDTKEAEEVFREVSQKGNQGGVIGKEGLAAVYAQRGQPEKSLEYIGEVEKVAPERGYVSTLRGDILYAHGKKEEAKEAYKKGVQKKEIEIYQSPGMYNRLGRIQTELGNYETAREFYDQAIAIDPYYVEATTNKGITLEKEGRWQDALATYQNALTIDKGDTFAAVLAKRVQEMLELNKDIERKKRIDKLVADLSDRFRSRKYQKELKKEDNWTSRPMILTFVDFVESGSLAERAGFATILTTELSDYLNSSGRVKVVERVLIERLLEELNLGSSELADPETALALGKILAAKLIGTGSLYHFSNGTLLSFKIMDTETSGLAKSITRQLDTRSLKGELYRLNREILSMVMDKYPLQGYIVEVPEDTKAIINIGTNQGVVLGTRFEVIEDAKPIEFKGKLLKVSAKSIGEMEIVQVEPGLSFAKILHQERAFKSEDKVKERIDEKMLEEKDVY